MRASSFGSFFAAAAAAGGATEREEKKEKSGAAAAAERSARRREEQSATEPLLGPTAFVAAVGEIAFASSLLFADDLATTTTTRVDLFAAALGPNCRLEDKAVLRVHENIVEGVPGGQRFGCVWGVGASKRIERFLSEL